MCIKKIKSCLFHKVSTSYQDAADLMLRLVLGLFMLGSHGWEKFASFSEKSASFPDPLGLGSALSLGLATFAEFFCSILLILGLFTRFASFSILITMLVAGLIFHGADPFNEKEMALLYAAGFLYFTIVGGNRFSLDEWIRKKFINR